MSAEGAWETAGRRSRWRHAFWAVAVVLMASAAIVSLARSRTVQLFGPLVPRVQTTERAVALTFDDGPDPAFVDEMLATLASRGVRATFFVMGADLERDGGAGRRLVAAGHELANHTYSHEHMVLKSPSSIRQEIERTDALIRATGQRGPIYFRPPFCWKLVGLPWFLWRTGRTTITWDVEPNSYSQVNASSERIVAHVLEHVRPGSIILLHPWYSSGAASRAALPGIVDGLHASRYRLVTVDELLGLRR